VTAGRRTARGVKGGEREEGGRRERKRKERKKKKGRVKGGWNR